MTFNDGFPTIPGPLTPSDPIFVKLETMKIEDIYKYQVSKFIFKSLNQLTPVQFTKWFKLNYERHDHRTRSNFNIENNIIIKNLFVPSIRTSNYGLKQLKVNGPKIWNELPFYLKNETFLQVFLKKLKIYYISRYD